MKKMSDKKKRLLLSTLALAEIIALFAGITFSWIEGGKKSTVNGKEIQVSAGSELTMLYDGANTNSIQIPFCELEEASSEDGRNFFFPMNDNTSSSTPQMTFREGTAEDRNKKYISMDFQLVAGTSAADVYLGAGTIIQCSNKELMSALRMSFSTNDGSTPIVFKPNQMPDVSGMQYSPIVAVSGSGVATQGKKETKAFADYYYSGHNSNKLFELAPSETKNITLSIWLEGTAFSGNNIQDTDLSVYIDFTTQLDNLTQYKFVDNTHTRDTALYSHWVSDKPDKSGVEYDTMMYIYDNTTSRYYALKKTGDHTWVGYIPNTINNFYFRRYSIDIDTWWNEWEPDMSDIKTASDGIHTFVAIAGQEKYEGEHLDGCYGYWKDSVGTYRIYFNKETDWSNVYCYVWSSSGDTKFTGQHPGKPMNRVGSSNIYYIDLDETVTVTGIQFNNGSDQKKIEIKNKPEYYFNGMIFKYNGTGTGSCSIYTAEQDSLIYPHK